MAKKSFNVPDNKSLLESIAGREFVAPPAEPDPVPAAEPAVQAAPAKKPRNTTGFYLAPEILNKLDACAQMSNKSRSEICRDALEEYFVRHQDLLDKYQRFLNL